MNSGRKADNTFRKRGSNYRARNKNPSEGDIPVESTQFILPNPTLRVPTKVSLGASTQSHVSSVSSRKDPIIPDIPRRKETDWEEYGEGLAPSPPLHRYVLPERRRAFQQVCINEHSRPGLFDSGITCGVASWVTEDVQELTDWAASGSLDGMSPSHLSLEGNLDMNPPTNLFSIDQRSDPEKREKAPMVPLLKSITQSSDSRVLIMSTFWGICILLTSFAFASIFSLICIALVVVIVLLIIKSEMSDTRSESRYHITTKNDLIMSKYDIAEDNLKVSKAGIEESPSRVSVHGNNGIECQELSRHLWLGQISSMMTNSLILSELRQFGEVESMQVLRSSKCAFVHYKELDAAVASQRLLDGKLLCDSRLKVKFILGSDVDHDVDIKSQSLYISGLPSESDGVSEAVVKAALEFSLSQLVQNISNENILPKLNNATVQINSGNNMQPIPKVNVHNHKGIAFVDYATVEDAVAIHHAAKVYGLSVLNRRVSVAFSRGKAARHLWVGNLASSLSKERLESEFSAWGTLLSLQYLPNSACAFVHFLSLQDAILAKNMLQMKDLDGKRIKVSFHDSKKRK